MFWSNCVASGVLVQEYRLSVLAQCIGSGVGSGVGSRVGLVVGLGVFDGRDDNVFMTDTKQNKRTKKGFTKTSGGPYTGRFGFPI